GDTAWRVTLANIAWDRALILPPWPMLSPAEAARLILEHLRPLPAERRPLRDALDLVLAEDVASPMDLPPWDNSAMDGYAVRGTDVAGRTRAELHVVETVPAGRFPT